MHTYGEFLLLQKVGVGGFFFKERIILNFIFLVLGREPNLPFSQALL